MSVKFLSGLVNSEEHKNKRMNDLFFFLNPKIFEVHFTKIKHRRTFTIQKKFFYENNVEASFPELEINNPMQQTVYGWLCSRNERAGFAPETLRRPKEENNYFYKILKEEKYRIIQEKILFFNKIREKSTQEISQYYQEYVDLITPVEQSIMAHFHNLSALDRSTRESVASVLFEYNIKEQDYVFYRLSLLLLFADYQHKGYSKEFKLFSHDEKTHFVNFLEQIIDRYHHRPDIDYLEKLAIIDLNNIYPELKIMSFKNNNVEKRKAIYKYISSMNCSMFFNVDI